MKIKNLQIAGGLAFLAFALLAVAGGATALAQAGRGSISGTIADPSGAIVPGVPLRPISWAARVRGRTESCAAIPALIIPVGMFAAEAPRGSQPGTCAA